MRLVTLIFIIAGLNTSNHLFAQPTIRLVKDIALGSNGSEPQLFTVSNNQLFFAGANGTQKTFNKLWKSDGTEQGTTQLTPTQNIYVIQQAANVGNSLFYWASGMPTGGLFKTDGTEVGTQRLLTNDYNPEGYYHGARNLFNFNGKLFFVASHYKLGDEPHISDGTTAGTFLLKDIAKGDNVSSGVSGITQVGNLLYFTAFDELGNELWCTDGTSEGTRLVIDLNPGAESSIEFGSSYSIAYKDTLFFTASTTNSYSSLYKTSGTSASTSLVKSFAYGIMNSSLFVHNGFMYFLADTDNTGYKLWKSDGTATGTVQLTSQGNRFYTSKFISVNDWLYFVYSTPSNGAELWKTDGTAANTTLVKDVRTGSANAFEGTINLATINGTLFFTANDGTHGKELWKSDGTANGTQLVKDINVGVSDAVFDKPIVYQDKLYFISNDADDLTRQECWRSNGTAEGTIMVKNIDSSLGLFDIRPEIVFQNKLYLSAKDDDSGSEVWRIDGNTISQLKEVNTTPADANPNQEQWASSKQRFIGLNNTLFFSADNIRYGRELWMTKGTEATTRMVKDFTKKPTSLWYNSTNTDSYFNGMIVYKNHLYVMVNGNQVWKIDEEGNSQLVLQNSSSNGTFRAFFTLFEGDLYFKFGLYGNQLWRTNGTMCTQIQFSTNGFWGLYANNDFIVLWTYNAKSILELWKIETKNAIPKKIKELNGHSMDIDNFGVVGDLVYFSSLHRPTPNEMEYHICRTDGTEQGTFFLTAPDGNVADGLSGKMLNFNDKVYHVLNNGSGQIWSRDSTLQGAQLVITLDVPLSQRRHFDLFDIVNGHIIFHFWIEDQPGFRPIYRSDGTQKGTSPISEDKFSSIYSTFTHNQKYYFFTTSELWEIDATPNGIRPIANRSISGVIQPLGGSQQSHNGKFYFAAISPQYGTELFVQEAEVLPSVAIKDNPERGQYIKYQATGAITATNQPTSYSTNSYQSNTSVTLEPGFETQPYAIFTAEIATPTLNQAAAPEIQETPKQVSNDVTVPSISRYEIEPVLAKIQNSEIYRAFKYPDANKPMPSISISKEKLDTGLTRYTFVVISDGKVLQESVEGF
ncbi:ELWxxDGT repeat protein [Runella defluvii]|uniref:ELWxxDGT repeat protein n=1 Tax=Runella defluvii TaxID=370973 RepID=A0A7W5ZNJ3_9BACT|nr:ELWxxDGT repeat protein [Runella defluvii]MBB3838902.1 ELWxxDGT repeat protein [Runella defluvii]